MGQLESDGTEEERKHGGGGDGRRVRRMGTVRVQARVHSRAR
jgi:hypothetical protein